MFEVHPQSSCKLKMNTSYFTDKLAPEIRLQIYGHALSFGHPLKRAKDIKKWKQRLAKLRDHGYSKTVNVSILISCKKVFVEAIEVFYKRNTIMLCHAHELLGKAPMLQKFVM